MASPRIIRPRRGFEPARLGELWRYRELVWILALRDIRVRYKQTAIGGLWAVAQPLLTLGIFTALFTLLGRVPASPESPYPVTLLCGLVPWQLFASALLHSSESIVSEQKLLTKVWFPRLVIPVAPILAGLVDFAIAFAVLLVLMLAYGVVPGIGILALPALVLLVLATVLAVSLWTSTLNALYRDFRYTLPFALQTGFILSPVVFETRALIPESWRAVYHLNPMVGVIEGFRWALLGAEAPPLGPMLLSAGVVLALFAGGLICFRRMERTLADWI